MVATNQLLRHRPQLIRSHLHVLLQQSQLPQRAKSEKIDKMKNGYENGSDKVMRMVGLAMIRNDND